MGVIGGHPPAGATLAGRPWSIAVGRLETAKGKRGIDLDMLNAHRKTTGLLLNLGEKRYKLLHQFVQEYAAASHP
jgi:hypothetical protein